MDKNPRPARAQEISSHLETNQRSISLNIGPQLRRKDHEPVFIHSSRMHLLLSHLSSKYPSYSSVCFKVYCEHEITDCRDGIGSIPTSARRISDTPRSTKISTESAMGVSLVRFSYSTPFLFCYPFRTSLDTISFPTLCILASFKP
jgi:hypothetical protein